MAGSTKPAQRTAREPRKLMTKAERSASARAAAQKRTIEAAWLQGYRAGWNDRGRPVSEAERTMLASIHEHARAILRDRGSSVPSGHRDAKPSSAPAAVPPAAAESGVAEVSPPGSKAA